MKVLAHIQRLISGRFRLLCVPKAGKCTRPGTFAKRSAAIQDREAGSDLAHALFASVHSIVLLALDAKLALFVVARNREISVILA